MHWPWNTYRDITNQLNRLEEKIVMTVNTDNQHLSDDVAALGAAVATIVAELKAANPSVDFSALDALVASTQAEAVADAPPVEPPVA